MIFPKLQSTGNRNAPFKKKLLEPITFTLSDGKEYTIEAGYETDLASVPRQIIVCIIAVLFILAAYFAQNGGDALPAALIVLGLILCGGLYVSGRAQMDEVAFVIHDWIFEHKKRLPYDRLFADRQMLYIMQRYKWNPLRPWVMYYAVRAFSWFYWYDVADKLKNR